MRWESLRPHLDFLYDLAMRETRHVQDAEDLVQEVAASVLRVKEPLRTAPRAYLAGAILKRAKHVRRGHGRRRKREFVSPRPVCHERPERAMMVREEVEAALASLDPGERQAVVLRYLHDLGYAETAAALGTTPEAARQRVHRALARLRERFGGKPEAALALLPLFAAPKSLSASPATITGALAMKAGTKLAFVALAFAAGVAASAGTTMLTRTPETPPLPMSAIPPPTSGPETVELESKVEELRLELGRYPSLAPSDLMVYSRASLRSKLAAIPSLAEESRLAAASRLGVQIAKTGEGVEEAVALLREEQDSRVLYWLAWVFYARALKSLPDQERDKLAPLVVHGQPAERRLAAVAATLGDGYDWASPACEDAFRQVFARETDTRVIRMASDVILFRYIKEPARLLLDAYRRMPAGEDRRWIAVRYRRLMNSDADTVARFDEAQDQSQREDWATALSFKFSTASRDASSWREKPFLRIYRAATEPRTRARLFRESEFYAPARPDTKAIRKVLELEAEPELHSLLQRILDAIERGEPLSYREAQELLDGYGRGRR